MPTALLGASPCNFKRDHPNVDDAVDVMALDLHMKNLHVLDQEPAPMFFFQTWSPDLQAASLSVGG